MAKDSFEILDESQRPVVEASEGHHLVLAPPGCGKTHILAERVKYARQQGIAYEDMLCLTFTNRAAREMTNRIAQVMDDDEDFSTLAVGNVHRFCSKFLFEANRVEADTSIIDDEEAVSIIADYRNEDEESIMHDFARSRNYRSIIFFSHLMYQMEHNHPWKYFLHPECFTDDDRTAVKQICRIQRMEYDGKAVVSIYRNAQNYMDDTNSPLIDYQTAGKMRALLQKMYFASCYEQYKADNHMLDFEDLLLRTYDAYREDATCKRYPWIQVDEVQDLNGMQLAIIDLLTAKEHPMVMYLGDEQQAIFSFMGARLEILTVLKMRCKDNIHHLRQNHRSPGYLLRVFNEYAEKQLKIDRELLPTTDDGTKAAPSDLRIVCGNTTGDEIKTVVDETARFFDSSDKETTAVVVSTNSDADNISEAMSQGGLTHFKVSGRDLFDTPDMKLVLAHLNVLANEHSFVAWTRIMKGLKVFPTNTLARRFEHKLKLTAITPTDFLYYDNNTYVNDFLHAYDTEEIVVFDTETTGLNIFEDDIIEISAMKIRHGEAVGEPLDLYIETTKPIMPRLGNKVNPMFAIYQEKKSTGKLVSHAEAISRFLEYVGTRPVLGHNVAYDYHILDQNMNRYTGDRLGNHIHHVFDSLKLMRLLEPGLNSYKLETLLGKFGLSGENSHQAIDDVGATVSLAAYCGRKAATVAKTQREFIAHPKVAPFIKKFRENYRTFFLEAHARLYQLSPSDTPVLTEELTRTYQYMKEGGFAKQIGRFDYVTRYLQMDLMADEQTPNALCEHLSRYIMDLNTMKESDFCNSRSIRERIYITTVHKAKGLEFDNVIVYDAAKGRYPSAFNKDKRLDEEDARKFYVAISRAKKRLVVAYSLTTTDRYGNAHNRELTPFMDDIQKFFN